MARPTSDARDRVLSVAVRHLKRAGITAITLDEVAHEAGCAKGLVTYHFGSKDQLIHAAAEEILRSHGAQWQHALRADSFEAVVRQTWHTLVTEVRDGHWRAWLSLSVSKDRVIVQLVSNHVNRFGEALRQAAESQIRTMGLEPTVSPVELGQFVAASLLGMGFHLAAGVKPEALEGAHSAMWAAVLGMTRPAKQRGA
jgi:AcrR family transcriptional regulator